MKKLVLCISFSLIVMTSFGQWTWNLTFDDASLLNRVVIDTFSNHNNIWKIGHSHKTVFNTAHSSPNVIVTDTLNPYPINDTSSFTIIHIASAGWATNYPKVDIGGWYYVNSDTITDHGYIEFSSDHGNTWFNLDSTINHGFCTWGAIQELPTFSGNSNGWKHFYYCLNTATPVNFGDTILYRFTFVSDGIQTNKDGLMFDDLHFEDWAEGIQELSKLETVTISPNPFTSQTAISFSSEQKNAIIRVINMIGEEIAQSTINGKQYTLDMSGASKGIYFAEIIDANKNVVNKKIVVQ